MTTTTAQSRSQLEAPKLRLLLSGGEKGAGQARAPGTPPQPLASAEDASVLVAGRDAARRAAVIDELGDTMPSGTKFEHASAFWEVLVRADTSGMVFLSDELDEIPLESLMCMLSHRYPDLPVIALHGPAQPCVAAAAG